MTSLQSLAHSDLLLDHLHSFQRIMFLFHKIDVRLLLVTPVLLVGEIDQARHMPMDFDNRLIWIFVLRSLTIESRLSDYFKSLSRWIWSFKSLYLRKTFFVSFGNAVDISDFHCLLWFDVPMWLVAIWMCMILDVPSDIKPATMVHLGSGSIRLSIDIALTSISLTAIRLKGLPASNSVW